MNENNPTREAQRLWMRLYEGGAPWLDGETVGLGLAGVIAGEIARLATVEMGVSVTGGARGEFLRGVIAPVIDGMRGAAEAAVAGGSCVLKPYVDGGQVAVEVVRAGAYTPTKWDGAGRMTGCEFTARAVVDGRAYTRVEAHTLEAAGARITQRAYRGEPGAGREAPLSAVPAWADLAPEALVEGVDAPLFAHLRMPFSGTRQTPEGASVYARAIPLLREADAQFSRLLWEMESGSRALYVDMRAFSPDETEPGTLPFKRFYRTMDVDPQADTLFAEWSPQLRDVSQINALNEILQRVEDACGLSRGTISRMPEAGLGGAKTATELKMMRQRTFATVRDVQRAVEVAVRGVLRVADALASAYGLAPEGAWEATFDFDDSVVCDRTDAFEERVRLTEMGVMTKEELRAWYEG